MGRKKIETIEKKVQICIYAPQIEIDKKGGAEVVREELLKAFKKIKNVVK